MKNFGIKQIGFHQTGTVKGGLQPQQYSGSWGDRGQGNELQSAFENGLSWAADKVMNWTDYAEQGLAYLTGLIPGGMTADESLQDIRLSQTAKNAGEPGYTNMNGEYKMFPITGMPPALPALPKNADDNLINLYKGLEKQWRSYSARESQMKKAGLLDQLKSTLTVKRYEEKERAFNQAVDEFKANQPHLKKMKNDVILTRKQDASFKRNKAAATGDGRANNQGRPVMRGRQWEEVEKMMRNDPKAEYALKRYEMKASKGAMDDKALRKAKKDMLIEYIKSRPGFFDFLLEK